MVSILFVQYPFTRHIYMQDIKSLIDIILPNTTCKIFFKNTLEYEMKLQKNVIQCYSLIN